MVYYYEIIIIFLAILHIIIVERLDVRKKVRYNVNVNVRWIEMSTINITNARANLYQLVSDVNVGFNPITIVNNKGKNADRKSVV